jgi:hypothetical protein
MAILNEQFRRMQELAGIIAEEQEYKKMDAKTLSSILQPIAKEEGFTLYNQAVSRMALANFLKANQDKKGGLIALDDFANPDFIYVIHNDESKINDFRKKVNTQYPDFGGLLQQSRIEKVDNLMASVNKV